MNIYIGFDSRNDGQKLAYEICKKSILENTKYPDKLKIIPLVKKELEAKNIYYRENDQLASTEFTYTRFLPPYLNNYQDICLFCDSDFLWECDIYAEMTPYIHQMLQNNKAIYCVQHDYVPQNTIKMDNYQQTTYPRKNWSSLILFNCNHPDVKNLTVENVNNQSPAWLHRMKWCQDKNIGKLPHTYNYINTVYYDIDNPKVIHYSDGGPWHYNYQNCKYSEKWIKYLDQDQQNRLQQELQRQYCQQ